MASIDVIHVENHSSDSSCPSNDFSLLDDVRDGFIPNGDGNHAHFDFTNMHSTMTDVASDPNADVSLQLTKLISDNLSLKEALDKNNSMMKEQLSTIPAWRDLMILKTKQQEHMLQESNDKILSLEKEKANLLKKLDSLLVEVNNSKEIEDFCTKCETFQLILNNLFGEKDFFHEEKGILCSELKDFHADLEQNLIAVCYHLDVMLKNKKNETEKKLLKTFIHLIKFKIASLNGTFCATVQTDEETGYEIVHQQTNKEESVKECSLVSSDVLKKFEDLEETLMKKDEELNSLKKEKEELTEKLKVYDLKIQELEKASKSQFELMSNKLSFETSVCEKYKERCENLQQQIDEYQIKLDRAKMSDDHNAHELRQEIQNLQEILKMEQRSNQRDKEELSRVTIKCEELQVDYDRVTTLLEVVSRDEKEKIAKLQSLKNECESNEKTHLEQIDHLTAQLFMVQEQLNDSNATIRDLKEKLTLVEEESETIPVLKAQVQVYKKDFETTVAARDSAMEEVDRLTRSLKKYENSGSGSRNSSPSSGQSGSYISFASRPKEQKYECPICTNSFTNVRALENHVERCLKANNTTP